MKFAYLINAHKDASHVLRLIDRLNNTDTDFVIHVSKSSDKSFYKELKSKLEMYKNVYFCKREFGYHFGWGIVQATINGMETLIKEGSEFEYFHLLSGQDYPIKTNEEIFAFFKRNAGKQYMDYWKIFPKKGEEYFEDHPWGENRQSYRLNRFNFPWIGKTFTIPELDSRRLLDKTLYQSIKVFLFELNKYRLKGTAKEEFWRLFFSRLLPEKRNYEVDFEFFGGKTWFSFSRALIEHILKEHLGTSKWVRFYKYSLIPDEMYFHTITMHSKFASDVQNDFLREVEWGGGDGTHPIIWTKNDFERLSSTKNFWARKFEDDVDSEIMDLIDSKILLKKD